MNAYWALFVGVGVLAIFAVGFLLWMAFERRLDRYLDDDLGNY